MSPLNPDDIAGFIRQHLEAEASAKDLAMPEIEPSSNILELGILDSLGFITLLGALEEEFDLELDIGDRDPEEYTTLEGLTRLATEAS